MKTCIISYSFSGNNETLAKGIAEKIGATHVAIREPKERTIGKIIMDMLFGLTPKTMPEVSVIKDYDRVILMGPTWMEKVPSPLRGYLKAVKESKAEFDYITISGGALHKNPKLIKDVMKYGGQKVQLFYDMYVSDFIDKKELTKEDTQNYQLSSDEFSELIDRAVIAINAG